MSAYDTNHARVMAKLDKIETLLLAVIKQQEPVLPIRPGARRAKGDIIQDATYHRIAAQLPAARLQPTRRQTPDAKC